MNMTSDRVRFGHRMLARIREMSASSYEAMRRTAPNGIPKDADSIDESTTIRRDAWLYMAGWLRLQA